MTLLPVTLHGTAVRLEPLTREHLPGLLDVGLDPDLWRITVQNGGTPEALAAYVDEALRMQAAGSALPFALVEPATGRVMGSTRFGNYDAPSRRVEIGWTWVARPWQRTRVNTEAKYLLLRHAFELLALERVELKTDAINTRSRDAILRIGATQEGVLRRHQVTWNGRQRDSVVFSILREEWPAAKQRLETMLASRGEETKASSIDAER